MSGIGALGRLTTDTALLRNRLDVLSRQVTTGQKAQAPGDLVRQLPQAINLRAEIGRRDAYGTAIGDALARTQAGQSALQRLSELARRFADDVALKLDPSNPDSLTFAAAQAKSALIEVGQLLNTQSNGEYIFGGTDFQNPPVPNPDALPASGLVTGIAGAVATLGGGNAAAVGAATLAQAQDDSPGVTPFSAFVTDPARGALEPRRSVPSGDGALTPVGLFANRNADAVSTGETAGSWARDLLRGLASIAALQPPSAADRTNFQDFTAIIHNGLASAANALADEQGSLGLTQARLEGVQTRHTELKDALVGQLAGIEDSDLATVISRLKSTQATLEASYSAIGEVSRLTLTRYLT